jgi:hypothetical protein
MAVPLTILLLALAVCLRLRLSLRFSSLFVLHPSGVYFKGEIDELRIWDHSRSPADIKREMHTHLSGNEPGLVASYSFDEDDSSYNPHIVDDATGRYPLTMGGCAPCEDDFKSYAPSTGERTCLPSAKGKTEQSYNELTHAGRLTFGGTHCYNHRDGTMNSLTDAYPSRVVSGAPVGTVQPLTLPTGSSGTITLYGLDAESDALSFNLKVLESRSSRGHYATLSYSVDNIDVVWNGSSPDAHLSINTTITLPQDVRTLVFQSIGSGGGSNYLRFEYWAFDGLLASNSVEAYINLICKFGDTLNVSTHQCEQLSKQDTPRNQASQQLFENSLGKFDCRACEAGSYREAVLQEGACVCGPSCVACPGGYFSSRKGLVQCEACPQGYYQRENQSSSCFQVRPGFEALIPGMIEPVECAPGKYWDGRVAMQRCEECESGQYQIEPGKTYCHSCKPDEWMVSTASSTQSPCQSCPEVGANCNGRVLAYQGNVWHDPELVPSSSVILFHCINDGCPGEAATKMECKLGYEGPLCAICSDKYANRLGKCVLCDNADATGAALVLLGVLLLTLLLLKGAFR